MSLSTPRFVPEQVEVYQSDHLQIHPVLPFDAETSASRLADQRDVMAIDLGGDKVRATTLRMARGALHRLREGAHQALSGEGYLAFLEAQAVEAQAANMPIGVSAAIRLDGSRVLRTTNLPVFHEELSAAYDADFRNLLGNRSVVVNDCAAGIAGAATLLRLSGRAPHNLAFFICGSGLGASVIDGGVIRHVEAAHVPLVDALNPLGQSAHCHVDGNDFVCLERVTAMRAGIELLHERCTGTRATAADLAERAAAGDVLAQSLFQHSSTALAHAIAGVVQRFGFEDDTTVVLHGGAFESAAYRELITSSVRAMPLPAQPDLVFARDLSPNICLDGAGILAATGTSAK